MAMIPDFFKDCVVAIGKEMVNEDKTTSKFYIGTGFLVGYCVDSAEESLERKNEIYLVTNKHIVLNEKKLIVKFNKRDGETKEYLINLKGEDGENLYSYCDYPDIDIIVISINPETLINENSTFVYFSLENHALTLAQMKEQQIKEGDYVYIYSWISNEPCSID